MPAGTSRDWGPSQINIEMHRIEVSRTVMARSFRQIFVLLFVKSNLSRGTGLSHKSWKYTRSIFSRCRRNIEVRHLVVNDRLVFRPEGFGEKMTYRNGELDDIQLETCDARNIGSFFRQ